MRLREFGRGSSRSRRRLDNPRLFSAVTSAAEEECLCCDPRAPDCRRVALPLGVVESECTGVAGCAAVAVVPEEGSGVVSDGCELGNDPVDRVCGCGATGRRDAEWRRGIASAGGAESFRWAAIAVVVGIDSSDGCIERCKLQLSKENTGTDTG